MPRVSPRRTRSASASPPWERASSPGMLIPGTKVEDEKIGPVADQVKEKAKETGQEALERGKHVAEQAAETAKDAGREQAEQLKDSAQAKAQEARTA